jgi:L-glutamine---4-(methylsulfanyl)-2-oxobutanoate aminotransferase
MTVCTRLQPFGTTIFAEMSALAAKHNAVNLSQGFPDFDGPQFIKDAVTEAMNRGDNQYARMQGIPPLNRAVAGWWKCSSHLEVDPDAQVTITNGCTEGLAATFLGLLNPGDEVILFEPYYDSYRACIAMAGATPRFVTLHTPPQGAEPCAAFQFDPDQLRSAITPRTRAIVINTPHNPTGKVFTRDELALIADLCIRHNLIAITDEVYERLTFDSALPHLHLATFPGMSERTITLSSLGKTFSLTGWKIGWCIASPELSRAVRAAHQFLTFCVPAPLQHGAAAALEGGEESIRELVKTLRSGRDFLGAALERIGFRIFWPAGTYFIVADHTPISSTRAIPASEGGRPSDLDFCRWLASEIGIAAIPTSFFYEHREMGRPLVRFAFCKRPETLAAAVDRLQTLAKD